ncbi:hypothetical protein INT48_005409 [Thamnidium elegans]|uniref:Uncharacterized protein n=1 Tax=Thamnidium elegans TaxID=101142 RepID=A0A8H7SN35_9FUNG|nr:hypothetical protein INT48_005409 [Thamnidium elegans]
MKTTLSKYITNFEVIWSDSKRLLKVLNRLLDLLLKIHLAPEREQKYKAYVAKKKNETEQKKQLYINEEEATTIQSPISFMNKSRNGKRNLVNNERKRRRKYVKKPKGDPINKQKLVNKVIRCTERIETYTKFLTTEFQKFRKEQEVKGARKEKEDKFSCPNIRNQRRNATRCEFKDIERYKRKKPMNDSDKERKIAACNERIRYFRNKIVAPTESPVLNSISENDSDIEDSVEDLSRDVSRKQLKSLKGIIKEVLLNSEKKTISAIVLHSNS